MMRSLRAVLGNEGELNEMQLTKALHELDTEGICRKYIVFRMGI